VAEALRTVVTDRPENSQKAVAHTIMVALSPARIVLTRAARVYIQSLVGFLTAVLTGAAGAAGVQIPAGDFAHQLLTCASLAVAPTVMSVLMNVAELLAKLDETNPQLRA
jgi:hypothetical protein